jgi:adenylate cyclase
MDETIQKLAILYADVSGSTHIYEKFGDKVARENIEICISMLSDITAELDGKKVKTIGDEIMCSFSNPVKAAIAAKQMHEALRAASEEGKFSIGEMHVKIGWHYGVVNHRGEEIIGEAPIAAQQIIKLAKADEILTSEQSLESIPDEFKQNTRFIDTVEAEAWVGDLNVYGMVWEEDDDDDDDEGVTRIGSITSQDDSALHKSLILEYSGKQICLDAAHTHCHIGRGEENDLCINGKFTSKSHAEIVYRHGIFHLQDISTNGTAVYFANGRSIRLHREEEILSDHGTIYFGGTPTNDPDAAVTFHCESV